MAEARRNREVDRLLAAIGSPQQGVAQALRDLVLETGPELQEEVKWGTPCYIARKIVCAISVHADHTNLQFYHGTSLRDPKGLLEGTGKSLRHVKLHTEADVRPALLRPLLRQAIELDAD